MDKAYRERVYGRYVTAFKGEAGRAALDRHARYLDHLLAPVVGARRPVDILEVGCGPGHFLYWASTRGFEGARGFDLSAEQVGVARSLDLAAEVASFRDYLPGRRESCDLIVAFDVVEHLTRDEAFELLELCRAALRPGGTIFLTTPNGAGLRPGPVAHGDLTHETIFTPQTIELALRLTGFEDIASGEISPPPTSLRSRVRAVLWRVLRLWPMIVDVVETGGASTRVYTRVMWVRARRTG